MIPTLGHVAVVVGLATTLFAAAVFALGGRRGDPMLVTLGRRAMVAAFGLALLGCTVVPTGPGNVEVQVRTILDLGVTGYVGTPSFLLAILKQTFIDPLSDRFALLAAPNTIDFGLLVVLLLTACVAVSAAGSGITLRRFLRV